MYKKRERGSRTSFLPQIKYADKKSQTYGSGGKKAQVTIFIILGLLLLIAVVLILVLRREAVTVKPEELTPPEEGKVEDIVRLCIAKLGNDAVFQLGLQGGYIEVPPDLLADGSSHLKLAPFLVVPYWAVGENVRIPSQQEMEQRLSAYLEKNIRSCVFSQQEFLKSYDLVEHSDPKVSTELSSSRIIFNVDWQVDVRTKAGETIARLSKHNTALPIRLKVVYETARRIMEKELAELKLEDLTQDMIALEHPKLPLSGVELSCRKKRWAVKDAKKTLQDMLRVNIKQLKVSGTEFVEFPKELPYYQNHYVWNFGEDFTQPNVDVVFNFENTFPMTFQVTPSNGDVLQSGSLGGAKLQEAPSLDLLSNFCVQNWKFTYDVIYPVLVQVTDEKNNYRFQFAFTVHLIRNTPNRAAQVFARAPGVLPYASNEEYCSNARIPMNVLTWELVENNLGVRDQQPLDGAQISFTCLKYPCDIGKTIFNYAEGGYQAALQANFPYCVGGILRAEKSGYKESWERVVTENGKNVELFLTPLYQIPVSALKVLKHSFHGASEPVGPGVPLESGELAMLRMKVFKDGKEFHSAEQVIGLDKDALLLQNLSLLGKADFTYDIDLQVFGGENLLGGYRANWTLPWNDLRQANEITFHVLTGGSKDEVFEILLGLPQYSGLVPAPEVKKK